MAIVEECTLARISVIFTRSPYWYAAPVLKLPDLGLSLFPAFSLFQPECARPWCVLINHSCGHAMLRRCACVLGLTKQLRAPRPGHGGGKDEAPCPKRSTAQPHDYCRTILRGMHGRLRSRDNRNLHPSHPAFLPPLQEVLEHPVN